MEEHALKNVNNYLNTNIYSYLETSGGQSSNHRYRKAKIDCLRFVMCPLLAQLEIGFFSSFSAAAVYSTNKANKTGLKQSIIFRCLWF